MVVGPEFNEGSILIKHKHLYSKFVQLQKNNTFYISDNYFGQYCRNSCRALNRCLVRIPAIAEVLFRNDIFLTQRYTCYLINLSKIFMSIVKIILISSYSTFTIASFLYS